jgi:hypothetical protein
MNRALRGTLAVGALALVVGIAALALLRRGFSEGRKVTILPGPGPPPLFTGVRGSEVLRSSRYQSNPRGPGPMPIRVGRAKF